MLAEAFHRAEINFDPAGFVFAVIELVPLLLDERRQDAPDKPTSSGLLVSEIGGAHFQSHVAVIAWAGKPIPRDYFPLEPLHLGEKFPQESRPELLARPIGHLTPIEGILRAAA